MVNERDILQCSSASMIYDCVLLYNLKKKKKALLRFFSNASIYDVSAPVIRVSNLQATAIRDSDNGGSTFYHFCIIRIHYIAERVRRKIKFLHPFAAALRFVPLGITVVHTEKRITIVMMAPSSNLYVGKVDG